MAWSAWDMIPIACSLTLALLFTPLVRGLARRCGMVAQPKVDRWHKKPTALLGGVAIALAAAIPCLALVPLSPAVRVLLAASAFLWLVGLIDDLWNIKPYQKLIGQVMGAALVVSTGLCLPWTPWLLVNMAITIFWLVGITNAVNLLDNMDGLAAGIALIASAFLTVHLTLSSQPAEALLLAVFSAALLGFLVYNSSPASIFMGDCGSMFIGFFLAGAALLGATGGRSRSILPVLAVPVLILLIPIFDTTLVSVLRKLSGRALSQGGRDHTSHRLVALGMSERRAVWLLYGLAALAGLLALQVRRLEAEFGIALIVGFSMPLILLGVYLAGVKVYAEADIRAAQKRPLIALLIDLSYKRRVFEVLLDVVLIILAYHASYTLLFGSVAHSGAWQQLFQVVPILVVVQLAAFLITGVYRGLWRYISVDDLLIHAKAVVLGSVTSVLILLFAFRFNGLSRAVFVLDGLLLLVMLTGTRLAFRLFRHVSSAGPAQGRRVLIYGAGDAGELLLRELLNNRALQYVPVGFADDDPLKKGKVIHGLRVFGGNGSVRTVCERQQVEEIVISSLKVPEERVKEIVRDCGPAKVAVKRLRIHIEHISAQDSFGVDRPFRP